MFPARSTSCYKHCRIEALNDFARRALMLKGRSTCRACLASHAALAGPMHRPLWKRAAICWSPGRFKRILCVLERCPAGPLSAASHALSLHRDVSHLARHTIGDVDRRTSADDARIISAFAANTDLVCFDGVELHQRIARCIADAVYRLVAALAKRDGQPPLRTCLRRIGLQF